MLRVAVLARPGARYDHVELSSDDTLIVHVRARPVEGQANAAIERAVAAALGLRPRAVSVVGGARARHKLVDVNLPDMAAVRERLLAHAVRTTG
jgi:uncharacterized protein YggU (UPF0235/DUF167 family)